MQPHPKIDPKEKGKAVLEETSEPEKTKVKSRTQMELDAEVAQQFHQEELAKLERLNLERQQQEEASQAAIAEMYDEVRAEWMLIMS